MGALTHDLVLFECSGRGGGRRWITFEKVQPQRAMDDAIVRGDAHTRDAVLATRTHPRVKGKRLVIAEDITLSMDVVEKAIRRSQHYSESYSSTGSSCRHFADEVIRLVKEKADDAMGNAVAHQARGKNVAQMTAACAGLRSPFCVSDKYRSRGGARGRTTADVTVYDHLKGSDDAADDAWAVVKDGNGMT